MAPKKKKRPERFRCDEIEGERFHAQVDDVFRYNWWEVFCFPYILCSRIWDCLFSICAGTNQCIVYWMMIQWIVCKITRITTPDPILFPYFFYMFCQVLLLTAFFIMLWLYIGDSVVIPYFRAYYEAFNEEKPGQGRNKSKPPRALSFRKYCFSRGELFDTAPDSSSLNVPSAPTSILMLFVEVFVYDVLQL